MSIMVFTREQDAYSLVQRIALLSTSDEDRWDQEDRDQLDELIFEARAIVRERRRAG